MKKDLKHKHIFKKYDQWRHTVFNNKCFCIDIDSVEIRNEIIVAIIETTMFKYKDAIKKQLSNVLKRATFQLNIQKQITDVLQIPLYLVIHTEDLKYFLVYNYTTKKQSEMDEITYMGFITNLGTK